MIIFPSKTPGFPPQFSDNCDRRLMRSGKGLFDGMFDIRRQAMGGKEEVIGEDKGCTDPALQACLLRSLGVHC